MRRPASSFVVAAAFGMLLLGNSSAAHARGNCQAKLVGKSYNCFFTYTGGAGEPACVDFATGGLSADFDAYVGGADFGCACDSSGPAHNPSFDSSSKSFECVQPYGQFDLINGKITGKALSLQGTSSAGDSIVGSCTEQSSPCP
jgi:hypothetical protein